MSEKITPGEVVRIHPRIRRITAPNPGVMTGPGTNAYFVGHESEGPLALIDPGPDIESHIAALIKIAGARLKWILCTHTHRDHSPAANAVRAATGARVHGFARVPADGRQDEDFKPDVPLVDGNVSRVLQRWHAIAGPPDATDVRKAVWQRARQWLAHEPPRAQPGAWNQALMELGALVCTARVKKCEACPVRRLCPSRDTPIPLRRRRPTKA